MDTFIKKYIPVLTEKHIKTRLWQYSRERVEVSMPTIGNKNPSNRNPKIRMRIKDVALSVVLDYRE